MCIVINCGRVSMSMNRVKVCIAYGARIVIFSFYDNVVEIRQHQIS